MALYENVSTGGGEVTTVNVILRDKYTHIIIPKLKHCTKIPNPVPISSCINKNAKYTQSFNLGEAGGASIRVDGWEMAQVNKFNTMFFSADKCIMTLLISGDIKQMTAMAFNDVKLGIKGPKSVFTLPPYCKKAIDEQAIHHLAQQLFEVHQARQRFFE